MNRRFFRPASLLLAVAALLISATAQAQNRTYLEGTHYFLLENAPPLAEGNQVLTEAFSYMCNHCNTFEPYIQSWEARKPENVDFERVPVIFGRSSWELYARGYVTADMLGIADDAHASMMDRLWKERRVMRSMEELADFYADYGVEPDKFLATSKSFAVDAKMRKDQLRMQEYQVRGTPTLILNGRYRISGSAAVPSYDVMLDVVDHLIAMEEQSRAAAPAAESE